MTIFVATFLAAIHELNLLSQHRTGQMVMIVKYTRFDELDWDSDYATRVNPSLMNELLHKAVPVLEAANWRITDVRPGYCESMLPLNHATTNQHGTHQAALISLSADYTGGMALTTLLRGVPLAGIHRCQPSESASLWLVSMNVKYIAPSTGHLVGRCQIPEKERDTIIKRYTQGKRVLVTLPVEFESNGQKIAQAELSYFAQPTIQLLEPSKRPSTLFSQKIKASARMIAGVRAGANFRLGERNYRFDRSHAAIAAGPQGELLAQRLQKALPQLTDMVLARTHHCDQTLLAIPGLRQVLLVGAGLDMRPFRMRHELPEVVFFEIDLPPMLDERDRVIRQFPDAESVRRVAVAADFILDDMDELLLQCPGLDPRIPTAVVYEGCTMYFDAAINEKMFRAIRRVLLHPDSRLWADFVSGAVVRGETDIPEVASFLKRMEDLGESFVFGHDAPCEFVKQCGMSPHEICTVREFRHRQGLPAEDPVWDEYFFCVAGC